MNNKVVRELFKVCEAEREALKLGDFDRLVELEKRKESALLRLVQVSLEERDIKVAKAEVERGQILLSAAINGLAAARKTMKPHTGKTETLSIYDKTGLRQNLPK